MNSDIRALWDEITQTTSTGEPVKSWVVQFRHFVSVVEKFLARRDKAVRANLEEALREYDNFNHGNGEDEKYCYEMSKWARGRRPTKPTREEFGL